MALKNDYLDRFEEGKDIYRRKFRVLIYVWDIKTVIIVEFRYKGHNPAPWRSTKSINLKLGLLWRY